MFAPALTHCGPLEVFLRMPENDAALFLDTTAHFNRQSTRQEVREEIERLVSSVQITGTSTYSRLEFKRSFVQDLAYLHGKLREFGSLGAVFDHLSRLQPQQHRKLSRVLVHLGKFYQHAPGGERETVEAILLAIEANALTVMEWFDEGVDYVADGTGCVRSKDVPRLIRGHLDVAVKNCRVEDVRCRIHRFFEENRLAFGRITAEIDSLQDVDRTEELVATRQIIRQALINPGMLCDDRVCRRLGDALIAVDSKGFPSIASSNLREFRVLCAALRIVLKQLLPS